MFDFKHKHKSNWPVRDRQPSFLEYAAFAFIFTGCMYGLMLLALYKATTP